MTALIDFITFFAIYFIVGVSIVIIYCIIEKTSDRIFRYLVAGLIFRILLTYAYYLYTLSYGSDAEGYFNWARAHYQELKASEIVYKFGTQFIYNIASCFYYFAKLFSNQYLMMYILFSACAFVGSLLFFKTISFLNLCSTRNAFLFTFCLPNLIFWTSNVGKDSLIYLGIVGVIFSMLVFQNKIIKLTISMICFSYLVYIVRPHILVFLLVSFTFGFLFNLTKASKSSVITLGIILVGFIMFHQVILTYIGMNKSFKSNDFDENRVSYIDIGRDQLNERARSLNTGGAKTDVNSVTMGGFPLFVIKFIGSPFIWQAQKPIQYLSSIEAIIYQFMMLYIIINIYHLKRLSFLPFKMHWIVFLLITSAIFGAAYTNYGLTIRQKCQIIPALVMLYLAVRKHKETSLNDKKRDVNKVKVFPMPNYT